MKLYKFGEYIIKIYENEEELKKTPLEGFRSLCPNKIGKPLAIEVIGEGIQKCEKEWAFCHLINSINNLYKVILEEVK
jgi:hypothetical protein